MKDRILKPTKICEKGRTSLKSKYHHPHPTPLPTPAHGYSVFDFPPKFLKDVSKAIWVSTVSRVLFKMNEFSQR